MFFDFNEIDRQRFTTLTLMSSESCNLSCSYCQIAQSVKNNKHAEAVKQAFKDGSFLRNILKIYKNLELNPDFVEKLALWGQEPTTTMIEVADAFAEFYKYFSNIKTIEFSTNGVAYYDRMIYFIQKVDEVAKKDILFEIQVSHDGKYSTEKYRGVKSSVILNNIENFFKELNKLNLKRAKVRIHFHGVCSRSLIKTLVNNKEAIRDYWTEWDSIVENYRNICSNPRVSINSWSPGMETPVNASKEEGEMLADFYRQSYEIYEEGNFKFFDKNTYEGLADQVIRVFKNGVFVPVGTIEEIIFKLAKYSYDEKTIKFLSRMLYCGPFYSTLKFRYDGTLVHCQNVIHCLDVEDIKDRPEQEYKLGVASVEHGHYPQGKTSFVKNTELQKMFYRGKIMHEQSFPQIFTITVNLMKILLDAGQIHESYSDYEKLMRHAFMISFPSACMDSEQRLDGTAIGRYVGLIRYYCNGFMDFVEELYDSRQVRYQREYARHLERLQVAEKTRREKGVKE